ncbi:hypothetical protein [Streptomyces meridianus]|uniref:Uncharacterized protein n=1 Tax=Streptomyces meridianus TaxID=2938945 RepID=A0ABT0XAM8_9ACTN|nr:hypothetical protein [Streptomyces meridianus]MCM2579581.1 hypothetical protein [Streptomyces meridianus]
MAATAPHWEAAGCVRGGSLARLHTRKIVEDTETGSCTWEFGVHVYGPDAAALAGTMAERIITWDRKYRHTTPVLTVRPVARSGPSDADVHTVVKRCARLEFRRPAPDVEPDRPLTPSPATSGRRPRRVGGQGGEPLPPALS